jgi:rSAM/selenodomain-associated transferase 1
LHDLLNRLRTLDVERFVVFSPAIARPYFAELVGEQFALAPQQEGSLGHRLAAFVADRLHAGAGPVVVVGMDSPTVPLAFIRQAFAELEQADVVLGPATDGGYYLVGCARRLPPIFTDVRWSSPHVLADSVACLGDLGWRLALLPPWYDVDTMDDLEMLRGHLMALRRAGVDPEVPRTEQLLGRP